MSEPRPFSELRDTGLLWLINTVVFHPRGYAFAIDFDDDGEPLGWRLVGGGMERWVFDEAYEEALDERFQSTKELMG